MNPTPVRMLSVFLALVVASAASGQTLWNGTRYGMTFDDVKGLFPNARDDSFQINGRKTIGPLTEKTTIADHGFEAQFFFSLQGAGLERVILRCVDKLQNDQGAAVARHFVELLQTQYGDGKLSGNGYDSDPRDIERVWITQEKKKITLSYFADTPPRDGSYKLSITYDGRALQGTSKL